MKQGTITSVNEERSFFFIDREYFCHFSKVNFKPALDMTVEYTPATGNNGKKQAENVKISIITDKILEEYYSTLENGYFDNDGYLLEDFILKFPQQLAKKFQNDPAVNKSTQLRKYFDQVQIILGRFKINKKFQYVKIELSKILPLLNAAKTKGHISEEFLDFMTRNIEAAKKSESNFSDGFVIHLQSLIAYYKL